MRGEVSMEEFVMGEENFPKGGAGFFQLKVQFYGTWY